MSDQNWRASSSDNAIKVSADARALFAIVSFVYSLNLSA